ncbi:uncharacterized protein LOC121180265 isoform X1 [Toxotes jaculatrix]|uniref:uncharacterized protein LOC121180265 isoform X1 n=1 Tax=Toxotes jaculatrix TaxID=941984 RepID=UPI001B3A97C9|nr:uncharacterized protein LOC121180265 isoform X1 [Toxotes jaculatrix]
MESQRFYCLFFMLTWIFVVFLSSLCSGMDEAKLSMNTTVFVALKGEDLNISCNVMIPANQSKDTMICYDNSSNQIYSCDIPDMAGQKKSLDVTLQLKHVNNSGEYHCKYKTAMVHWFLRVRVKGYEIVSDYTGIIPVAVITCVLLVFSAVGSVYVFRGHWKEQITECGKTARKQTQSREEREAREMEEENSKEITAPSTSFYASLEPRPRSIYEVLDHSAANREPDKKKAKPKNNEPQKTTAQTTHQEEGIFESVYENF